MSRFPSMGMKALLAKHPKAERCVQIRIFNRDGDVIELEGPCTNEEAKAIVAHAFAPMRTSQPSSTSQTKETP